MKTIEEIRYENVLGLIQKRFAGNAASFSRAIQKEPGQTNQFAGPNPTKTIGSVIAREIEKWLELEIGSLDHEMTVRAPKTNVIGSMGVGTDLPNSQEITDWIEISLDWAASRRIAITSPQNLALIEGRGNSMEGVFNHGDILIADTGVSDVDIDGIYVFKFEDKVWIKTLQRMPGKAFQVISNNPSYKEFLITEANGESFSVLAKVVWIWNGKAL